MRKKRRHCDRLLHGPGYAGHAAAGDFDPDPAAFKSLMSALTELMSTDEEFIRSFGDLSSLAR